MQVADYPTLRRELNDVHRATIASALNIPEVELLTSGADLSVWEQMSMAIAVAKQACRDDVHLVSTMQPNSVATLRCGASWSYHIKRLAGIIFANADSSRHTDDCPGNRRQARPSEAKIEEMLWQAECMERADVRNISKAVAKQLITAGMTSEC